MALTIGSLFEVRDTATTGNVNGAGFNPSNANFVSDFTTDAGTGNTASPVLSSASYNFVAGDVGAWIYVQTGTNWNTKTFLQVASVSSNKATLSAAIGAGLVYNAITNLYIPTTVAGIATVGTPTGGTCGVDYSQQNTAQTTATDFTSIGSSATLTSATAAFTRVMVGNFFHQTTTGTGAFGVVGWYEISNYTNATTVTLDRTPNSGTASVSCTGFIGGAGRLNALETGFFDMLPAAATVYTKNGTYTVSGAVNSTAAQGTSSQPVVLYGYNSIRSDTPSLAQRPTLACGSNTFTPGTNLTIQNINFTTTASTSVTISRAGIMFKNCKFFNSSPSVGRVTLNIGINTILVNCEVICQNGTALSGNSSAILRLINCYIHDSGTGISASSSNPSLEGCIIESCSSFGVAFTSGPLNAVISNCTFYGRKSPTAIGLSFSGATTNATGSLVTNNIFYGWVTGVSVTAGQAFNAFVNNDYFNNTTNLSAASFFSPTEVFVDPQFVGVTDITGTTASTAASVLTDSSANFSSIVDGQDFVRIISGTGTAIANYLIIAHTTTTLTVNNTLGTGGSSDKIYVITTGHNYNIGTNLKAAGTPGSVPGSSTTGYMDIGVAQRQEAGTSATFVG